MNSFTNEVQQKLEPIKEANQSWQERENLYSLEKASQQMESVSVDSIENQS